MPDLIHNLTTIQQRICRYEQAYGRAKNSVSLLAVSKTFPLSDILALNRVGQRDFGENYLLEAITKISADPLNFITWHFIGVIQSNKAGEIAKNFSWVHTVTRLKDAQRLSQARPGNMPPLNICLQVKLDDSPTKNGLLPHEVPALVAAVKNLPNLQLRGLMSLPALSDDFDEQRKSFRLLANLQAELIAQGTPLDTLSMGTTHDMEAAIAEGATLVRVGTGLFGFRQQG